MPHNLHPYSHPRIKKKEFIKFLLLLLVFISYFGYLSWEYDLATGGIIAALTWSFFVLCTPVADAGFLLDFPIRLITGIRMLHTELFVWALAFTINLTALTLSPTSYEVTFLTSIFHKILTTPWPYWTIILLCTAGTFLSIYFGDEVMDAVAHKTPNKGHKHNRRLRFILVGGFYLIIVFVYYHLLETLGIQIPGKYQV